MIGSGSQSPTSCVIRSHVIRSFWLRRRSVRLAADDVAHLVEALAGRGHIIGRFLLRPATEKPNHRHRRLLRLRREGPRHCAAETDNELPSLHARSDLKTTVSLSKLDT